MFEDLREWMDEVRKMGELREVKKAHWNQEIGAVTDMIYQKKNGPTVLFDEIVDYPKGYRILVNSLSSPRRLAYTLGLPIDLSGRDLAWAWKKLNGEVRLIPPVEISKGPILENVHKGETIDLTKFPTPKWHILDGGRYIGTGCTVITKDPDVDWVNMGTYRIMLVDRNHVCLYISPGKHGAIHRGKYLDAKKPFPVVITFGQDPLLFLISSIEIPYEVPELAFVGGIRHEPVPVVKGEVTGLPIPSTAEIAIEGWVHPGHVAKEGPFGEWTGYYASSSRDEPVLTVERLYHRNNPIILGCPPGKPPVENTFFRSYMRSVLIEEELQKAGIPDVIGVWCHEVGGCRLFNVISIKQRYPGHARQAATVAASTRGGAYLGRYTIVVDEDIDFTDLTDVVWAVCTRTDPSKSIDFLNRFWSGPLDPVIPPGEKGFSSRAVIDACRPFEWKDRFPEVVKAPDELMRSVRKKWGAILD
jgi:4-hydroxy-3-polyprenylbenzoate decarboxylase